MANQLKILGCSPTAVVHKRKYFEGVVEMSRTQTSDNLDFTNFLLTSSNSPSATQKIVKKNPSGLMNDNQIGLTSGL
jgi:hypothetical protein